MARHRRRKVFGEPVDLLLDALRRFESEPNGEGRVTVHADLPPEPGGALVRALMRAEAELLVRDAARIGTDGSDVAWDEERSTAALFLLLGRLQREQRRAAGQASAPQRA